MDVSDGIGEASLMRLWCVSDDDNSDQIIHELREIAKVQ